MSVRLSSAALINRCEVWPSRQKVAECNWADVDSLVRPDQASVTGGDGDNSLIWRRWVNISKRAITGGEERNSLSVWSGHSRWKHSKREAAEPCTYLYQVLKAWWAEGQTAAVQAVHVLIYLRCDTFAGPKGCGNSQPKHDITTQEKVHNTSSTPGLGRAGNPILFAVIKYLKITNKVCYETEARTVG